MKIFQLKSEQVLPITIDQAWEFFSSPKNLQKITPKHMGFEIISGAEKEMYSGQIIEYLVSPLLGIKMRWVSEIKSVSKGEFFIDEQRFGPYKFWHHKHFFEVHPNGVKLIDHVHYVLPFGFLGIIAQKLFVGKMLGNIFTYREKIIKDLFVV